MYGIYVPLHLPRHKGPYILGKQVCCYACLMVWRHEMFNFQASKKNEKDTMDANTADDFRHSKDPTDRVLWHMRSDTGRCFDVCFGGEKTSIILRFFVRSFWKTDFWWI